MFNLLYTFKQKTYDKGSLSYYYDMFEYGYVVFICGGSLIIFTTNTIVHNSLHLYPPYPRKNHL